MWNKTVTKKISREEYQRIEKSKAMMRAERGAELVYQGHVLNMGKFAFVQSQNYPDVIYKADDNGCECVFFEMNNCICKHMFAYKFTNGVNQ